MPAKQISIRPNEPRYGGFGAFENVRRNRLTEISALALNFLSAQPPVSAIIRVDCFGLIHFPRSGRVPPDFRDCRGALSAPPASQGTAKAAAIARSRDVVQQSSGRMTPRERK